MKTRAIQLVAIAACFGLRAVGAAQTARKNSAQDKAPIGCYRIDLSKWSPALEPGSGFELPGIIFLDSVKGTKAFEKGRNLVRPKWRDRSFASWAAGPSDSIRISWTTGFSFVSVEARV